MEKNFAEIWSEALELLKQETSPIAFKTYVEVISPRLVDNTTICLILPSDYYIDICKKRFLDLIRNTLSLITNIEYNILFESKESFSEDNDNFNENYNNIKTTNEETKVTNNINNQIDNVTKVRKTNENSGLNERYTFENFIVGSNNRFAHAAASAVSENPGKKYNPLFIYGGVGLGKTHLMQAVGNRILRNNPKMNIVYVTSEKFTNHLINSIRDGKNDPFRNKYRKADALLIDDIQFIAKKERVQEEFFHTFNTLYENGKQIIISSDKPPRDIPFLEDRLKSRFEWGILADVSMADYETRLAILRKKTQEKQIIIDDDILKDIATKIDSNIRELEGVFNKLVAQSSLTNMPITIEMAEIAINSVIKQKESIISIDYIQEIVCKYFDINTKDLKSSQRSNDIAFPRQIGMYLCRILTNESFPKIGESFGNRDHTTVMHAFKKIEKEIKEKKDTKLIVESVKKIILNNN